MIRQLNIHNQVVIPKEFIQALGIRSQDYLDIRLEKRAGEIHLKPVTLEVSYSASEIKKLKKIAVKEKKSSRVLSAREFLDYLKKL